MQRRFTKAGGECACRLEQERAEFRGPPRLSKCTKVVIGKYNIVVLFFFPLCSHTGCNVCTKCNVRPGMAQTNEIGEGATRAQYKWRIFILIWPSDRRLAKFRWWMGVVGE